jgi:uncharacterized C2H2 Zn-finger protein
MTLYRFDEMNLQGHSTGETYEYLLECPRCRQLGTAVLSGRPPKTVVSLPPQFRVTVESDHSEDGKIKIRCRCDQLLEPM